MKIKSLFIILGLLLSSYAFSDGYYPEMTSQDQPWSVIASFGNSKYPHVMRSDKESAVGRFAIGNELFLSGDIALGLELGVQSGNQMRLEIPTETLTTLGWLPVKTNLGPMLDLLITAKSDPLGNSDFFAQIKGGLAYRSWQIEHQTINSLTQIAGEIQAGFGYPITALANLNLLYQGVYGSNPQLQLDANTKSGQLSNIPVLHAVLFGLSVNI